MAEALGRDSYNGDQKQEEEQRDLNEKVRQLDSRMSFDHLVSQQKQDAQIYESMDIVSETSQDIVDQQSSVSASLLTEQQTSIIENTDFTEFEEKKESLVQEKDFSVIPSEIDSLSITGIQVLEPQKLDVLKPEPTTGKPSLKK